MTKDQDGEREIIPPRAWGGLSRRLFGNLVENRNRAARLSLR
ncbi:hypothetical protein [Scytonema sp. PCC 10023]